MYNIALIGCGRIGFMLEFDPLRYKPCTHYGGAKEAGLIINYACDINKKRLNEFAKYADISPENTFTDYRELIKRVNPEMIIIAVWHECHADIGIFASNNGCRVIVCEKPISSDLSKAKSFLNTAKKTNVKIIINHERRYETRYRIIKKLLAENNIGEVKTVYASILTSGYKGSSKSIEGGGPLLHDGTHMIDIIRFLFGEIKHVEGEFQRKERSSGFEDRAAAWLKTDSGIDIFLEAGGFREYFIFELQISGTKGKIVIGNGYEQLFLNQKSRFYSGFRDLREARFPEKKGKNCFVEVYREAKKLLYGRDVDITSSGIDGYKSLEAIHAIYLSSHLNRKMIELPIKPGIIDIKDIFKL